MCGLAALGPKAAKYDFRVFGTDLDPMALAIAKRGSYEAAKVTGVPPDLRSRWLVERGDSVTVKPELAACIRFRKHNLFGDPPIKVVDVISCRNVFIYFSREQQEKITRGFHTALNRGGYLVLGRSERLAPELAEMFELVSGRERVYRKPL